MKKLLIFTITAAMLLSLTACAQSAKPNASLDTPAQEQTVSDSTQIPVHEDVSGAVFLR